MKTLKASIERLATYNANGIRNGKSPLDIETIARTLSVVFVVKTSVIKEQLEKTFEEVNCFLSNP